MRGAVGVSGRFGHPQAPACLLDMILRAFRVHEGSLTGSPKELFRDVEGISGFGTYTRWLCYILPAASL